MNIVTGIQPRQTISIVTVSLFTEELLYCGKNEFKACLSVCVTYGLILNTLPTDLFHLPTLMHNFFIH